MTKRNLVSAGLLTLALAAAPLSATLAQDAGDPPGRVGRVAEVSGSVTFHTSDANAQWAPASVNYPVTGGNAFWTEPRSHAAIDVGASRLYMDSSTELDVATVDDQSFVASLAQGAIYLRVSQAGNGDQYEIDTPRGAVHIAQPGSYEVIAGDQDHPTTVMAFDGGSAEIVGPGVSTGVASDQAIYINGQNPPQVNSAAAQTDDFIRFVQSEDQPYQNQNAGGPPPYVSPEMTGYQDLNRYGQWNQDPTYGQVWYPQVAADWAPYRDGHWAYVAPWGWTWVDDAPWGFTPFHYGRWVQVHDRWAWWPGRVEARPVYAPALVTFFGSIGGVNLALNFGGGQDVGWVPLAPDEVYVPPYRHSPTYVRNVNITYVRNETTIINVVNNTTVINNYNGYHNHNGATFVNASTMQNSRPVAADFRKVAPNGQVDSRKLADAKPTFIAPVKPTIETKGVQNYQGKGATGPSFAGGNNQHFTGKLPPLESQNANGKNNQGMAGKSNGQPIVTQGNGQQNGQKNVGQNGQNLNGQNLNGQNLNGQNTVGSNKLPPLTNGQNPSKNGQNNFGQNGQPQFGQQQNGQKTLNGQNTVGGNKLPPLPSGQTNGQPSGKAGQTNFGQNGGQNGQPQFGQQQNGQQKNNQFQFGQGQNNGQNNNGKAYGQNGGQNLNHQNGNGEPNKNNQFQFGQGQNNGQLNGQKSTTKNVYGNQGQFGQGQFGQGQFGQGQNNGQFGQNQGQNFNKQNGQPNYYNQQNGQSHSNANNNFMGGNNGPSNQKAQHKQQNGKGVYPPPNNQSNGQNN